MPVYVNDPLTEDQFAFYGDRPITPALSRELIGASIVEASQELLDGSYKQDAIGNDVDDLTAVKRLERNTALQLRVPIRNVDATSGISDSDRLALGFRPTMDQKIDYLRMEYGYRNVQAVPVNGSYRLIIKTEGEGENSKYKYVNEEGLDFGDITQFAAGATIPIVAATIATVAAPVMLPALAVAGWGSAAALATVSAGSYFGAGVLQDSAVAAYDGSVPDFAEIAKRRGVESAFAFVPEMAMIRGGQWLSGFAGSGADDVAKLLRADFESLKTTFTKVLDDGTELVPNLQAGLGGLTSRAGAATEQAASAMSPALRKIYQNNLDEVDSMMNALNGGSPKPIQEIVEVARDRLTQMLTKLSNDVTSFDPQLQGAVQKILQTKLKKIGGTERMYRRLPAGRKIQNSIQKEFQAARVEKRKLFDKVTQVATDEGIFYDVDSVLKAIRKAISEGGSGIDESIAARAFATSMEKSGLSDEAVLKALKEKLPLEFKGGMKDFTAVKTLSYKQLNTLIKKYAERSDFGAIAAVGETAGFSRLMLKQLSKVRDKGLKGTKTMESLKEANKFYRGKYGQFLRTNVKPIIKPDFGSGNGNVVAETYKVMGPEATLKYVLSDPKTVREVLKTFPDAAPTGALTKSEAEKLLKSSYISELGLNGTIKLGQGMKINVNRDVMSQLFGDTWDIKVAAIDRLNDLAKSSGKVIELDDAIFREILVLGTPAQAKNALKIAEERVKSAIKLAAVEQNKLFQAIIKKQGNLSAEDAMEAVGSLLNYSSDEISSLLKVIRESSPEYGILTLQNKLSTEIIELARPTKVNYPVTSRGKPLFDGDILLTKLKDVKIRKVAIEVLGKEWVNTMEEIARVIKYSTARPAKAPGVRPVISPGSGGMQTTFVMGDLLPDIGRFLYGRIAATPGLKQILTRKTPDEAAMVFRQWLPFYMATDEGLKSLALYSRDHPELAVYLQEELANLGNLAMEQDQAAVRRGEMNEPDQSQGN